MNKILGLYFMILLNFFSYMGCIFASDVALPTELLRNIRVNGRIELDCNSDKVFFDVYRMLSDSKYESRFFNVAADRLVSAPVLSCAWSTAMNGKSKEGGILILENVSLWKIFEEVSKRRNRKLIDLGEGVAFLEKSLDLMNMRDVVVENQDSEITISRLSSFTPKSLQILQAPYGNGVIDVINTQLKLSSKLAGEKEVIKVQIESIQELNGTRNSDMLVTFLGKWRYLDLFRVYGSIYSVKFVVSEFLVSVQTR